MLTDRDFSVTDFELRDYRFQLLFSFVDAKIMTEEDQRKDHKTADDAADTTGLYTECKEQDIE